MTSPTENDQYYGHFPWKGTQHVVVKTIGTRIVCIVVTSGEFKTEFMLADYDPTNKLHFKALFLVTEVLFNQSDADYKRRKWHASMDQCWPAEERLLPA